MGSFIITRRLGIDPAYFDLAQIAFVMALLLLFTGIGMLARRITSSDRDDFMLSFSAVASIAAVLGMYIGVKLRIPSLIPIPDLLFAMLSFSLGFFVRDALNFIGFFDKEPEPTPAEVRVTAKLDALMARQSNGSDRPIFTEALAFMPFCH